ncbi:multidrug efflux protein YfmO [Paenibacillus montaniterrae]|uniref:Multidrug efflux protein YfmO n=1 Tax=Paenibacillus montaniterrae TaxID=429341 RepID=A0A919YVK8_9BACL|nr:MFS transporter [Paenibacillus montaniterrae]GIP19289.1 multidrug efflux protein YfmO [Paenibacillus montaniterrae]
MSKAAVHASQSEQELIKHHKSSILHQPQAVWAVFFACIFAFMGIGLVDPILPAISHKLEASASQVTLLFTSYNAVMAVAMLITGTITSRLGMKNTLLAGIGIIILFCLLGAFSNGIWQLVAYRGGWGLGNALFVATALTAITTLTSGTVAQAIILYEAAIGLGIAIGPLLGGELGAISWRAPFLGVAVSMLIAFLALLFMMPKPKAAAKPHKKLALSEPFKALKHRSLLVLGITACLYNFGFFTLMAYAPFVLEHMGVDIHGIGYIFLGWGILLAVTSVFMAPRLQQAVGTVKSMIALLGLFGLTLLAMALFVDVKWVVVFGIIFAGALLGNNNTLITTAVMNAAPVERSTASAAYSFLRFIGGAIAPFLAGKLAEWFNSSVPFYVGGSFVLLSVVFLLTNHRAIKHVDELAVSH